MAACIPQLVEKGRVRCWNGTEQASWRLAERRGRVAAGTAKSQQISNGRRVRRCIAWGLLTKLLSAAMESPQR